MSATLRSFHSPEVVGFLLVEFQFQKLSPLFPPLRFAALLSFYGGCVNHFDIAHVLFLEKECVSKHSTSAPKVLHFLSEVEHFYFLSYREIQLKWSTFLYLAARLFFLVKISFDEYVSNSFCFAEGRPFSKKGTFVRCLMSATLRSLFQPKAVCQSAPKVRQKCA